LLDLRHCRRTPEFADFELLLLDLLCQFDAADDDPCGSETLQAQPRAKPLLDSPVILFDSVVPVLTGPDPHPLRQLAILFPIGQCAMGSSGSIEWDLSGDPLALPRLTPKGLGGIPAALCAPIEIHPKYSPT
jgi:hypothetical protein